MLSCLYDGVKERNKRRLCDFVSSRFDSVTYLTTGDRRLKFWQGSETRNWKHGEDANF